MARVADGSTAVPEQGFDDVRLAQLGFTRADLNAAAYWIDADGRPFRGADAIAKAMTHARQPWLFLGRLMLLPPASWVARTVYPLVVRFRHRLPGASDACRLDP